MDDKKIRKTNHNYSSLIENLYGNKEYKDVKDFQSTTELKNYLLKLIKTYSKVIKLNITFSDLGHQNSIFSLLNFYEKQIKLSKCFNELDQDFISFQSELIFLLIGKMPNNWSEKEVKLTDSNWYLNQERKIIYTQSNEQKVNVIFEKLSRGLYQEELPKLQKMRALYLADFKKNNDSFIEWFKYKYTKVYLELF